MSSSLPQAYPSLFPFWFFPISFLFFYLSWLLFLTTLTWRQFCWTQKKKYCALILVDTSAIGCIAVHVQVSLSQNPAFICVACFRAIKRNKSTTAFCLNLSPGVEIPWDICMHFECFLRLTYGAGWQITAWPGFLNSYLSLQNQIKLSVHNFLSPLMKSKLKPLTIKPHWTYPEIQEYCSR